MTVDVGMQERSKKKLMRSTWAGRVGKMGDEKQAKSQMPRKWRGVWRRGRPKLRWSNALKVT